MKNYKKQKYLFLYVSLLIVISSFAVLFLNFRKQLRLQNEILKIEANVIQADSLTANLLQIESDKRGFQLTNDANYLKNFDRMKMNSHSNVAKLKLNNIAAADTDIIVHIDSLLILRIANLDSGILLFTTKGFDAAIAFMEIKEKKDIRELLNLKLGLLKDHLLRRLEENTLWINSRSNHNLAGLLILLFIFILVMLVGTRMFGRAQQKIMNSEKRYRQIVETAQEGIWVLDENNYTTFVNKKMCEMLEYSRKEMMGKQNYYFKDDEGKKKAMEDIERRKSGITETQISKFTTKSGNVVWTSVSTNPIFDDEGKYVGALGMFTDITERKKNDEELIEAQNKFQAIFDNTADGIYQSTIDGKFIMSNPSMARIFGYDSPVEFISSITDIGKQLYADPADRQRMSELLACHDHVENFEASLLRKNGDIIWVSESTRTVRNEKGAIKYFEGTLKDITERKKAENELVQVQKKFQAIFDNTADGIYQSTIDGKFIMVNPSMARIFGYDSPGDLLRSVTDIGTQVYANPADREKMSAIILTDGHVEKYELQVFTKNKAIIWVSANIRLVCDEKAAMNYLEGTLENITERKKAEEEILQLNRNLDQFANITAHDLQEPIRMVSGFLGLLDKKYQDILDEQGRSYVYRAKDGADRMSILIKDLLEFSRSANTAAKKEPVDIKFVMAMVNNDLSIVIEDTQTTLSVPSSLPIITANQSALYRLFLNLVSNGIKFRKKDKAPEITITVKELPDCWEFVLQDNGIGIAEKDQPKLFQAFKRLHRREEYPGTGLGLVTCKKIVETHGGKIWMVSELGKGTAFHFTISKT
ncbi:MAG TPA: PAS domain S-box protein [Chitinophagaceae bacterium]|nr:PAS domain S-box protein [Chitinophagaceae bacterium]